MEHTDIEIEKTIRHNKVKVQLQEAVLQYLIVEFEYLDFRCLRRMNLINSAAPLSVPGYCTGKLEHIIHHLKIHP